MEVIEKEREQQLKEEAEKEETTVNNKEPVQKTKSKKGKKLSLKKGKELDGSITLVENRDYDVNNPPVITMDNSEKSKTNSKIDALSKSKKSDSNKENKDEFDELNDLSMLMNISVTQLKEEFIIFQIRKVMSKLGKVLIRYNVSDSDMEKVLFMADQLGFGRIVIAPVNLPLCEKKVRKYELEHIPVSSLIDFPFGESAFNSKLYDIRESKKIGVDEVLVTLPDAIMNEENHPLLRKQCRKIASMYRNSSGVVINASDISEANLKKSFKIIARSKISAIAIAFGKATLNEVKDKMEIIKGLKGDKKVYAMANVDTIEAFAELNKLDTDIVLTPFADKIGNMIMEKFNIKDSKLG